MDLIGYLLGNRYEIIEKIGDGGMATVYKAKCKLLNRYVAIKVLKEEFVNDEEFLKKFAIEAQAAASLSHPNIVSIYDVGREGNLNYIVMELVNGKTLKEIIKAEGKLNWKKACEIAQKIAQGIECAHKNHIIHRDIKPHNIIVTEDMQIKVADFGIAKATTSTTITMSGDTIGSVHYFSPEQAKGGIVTEKSDIYSLGVVLYEMLTGELPFNGDTPVSVALKHVQEVPKMPSEIEPTVPYCVNSIVIKAMQKDPLLRYQKISEMILDLNLALSDPNGNYVHIKNYENFATQKLEAIKVNDIFNNEDKVEMNNNDKKRIEQLDILVENNKKLKEELSNKKNSNKKEENILNLDDLKTKNKSIRKKKKFRKIMFFVILAILLFAGAFYGGLYITGAIGRTPDIEIPNIVGKKLDEAKAELEALGLHLEVISEINDNETLINTILSQNPTHPMKTKQGNKVSVVLSKGPEEVRVPDLKDLLLADAIFELEKIGLKYEQYEEISTTIEEGSVIRQSPEKNEIVKSETVVYIYVSSGVGEGKVKMPKLVDMTLENAKKIITENKLVLVEPITYKVDEKKSDNVVLSQNIPEDTIVDENSQVVLEVNKLIVEPDFVFPDGTNIIYDNSEIKIDLSKMTVAKATITVMNSKNKIVFSENVYKADRIMQIWIDETDIEYVEVFIDGNSFKKFNIK